MLLSFGWFYLRRRLLQLFDFLLLPLQLKSIKRKKAMCCKWRRERKTTEGLARGERWKNHLFFALYLCK